MDRVGDVCVRRTTVSGSPSQRRTWSPETTGGVRRWNVEGFEVVPVAFDLGSLGHRETHGDNTSSSSRCVMATRLGCPTEAGQRTSPTTTSPKSSRLHEGSGRARDDSTLAGARPTPLPRLAGPLATGPGLSSILRRQHAKGLLQRRQDRAFPGDRRLRLAQLLDAREAGDGGKQVGV